MLLTSRQAAQRLNVGWSTVHLWIKTGKLKAKRYGAVWMVDEKHLLGIVKDRRGPKPRKAAEDA